MLEGRLSVVHLLATLEKLPEYRLQDPNGAIAHMGQRLEVSTKETQAVVRQAESDGLVEAERSRPTLVVSIRLTKAGHNELNRLLRQGALDELELAFCRKAAAKPAPEPSKSSFGGSFTFGSGSERQAKRQPSSVMPQSPVAGMSRFERNAAKPTNSTLRRPYGPGGSPLPGPLAATGL